MKVPIAQSASENLGTAGAFPFGGAPVGDRLSAVRRWVRFNSIRTFGVAGASKAGFKPALPSSGVRPSLPGSQTPDRLATRQQLIILQVFNNLTNYPINEITTPNPPIPQTTRCRNSLPNSPQQLLRRWRWPGLVRHSHGGGGNPVPAVTTGYPPGGQSVLECGDKVTSLGLGGTTPSSKALSPIRVYPVNPWLKSMFRWPDRGPIMGGKKPLTERRYKSGEERT